MGPRPVVEQAFQSALLHVGWAGLRQPARCRSELTRHCANQSAEIAEAVALAATGAQVLDRCADGDRLPDDVEIAAVLTAQGVSRANAEWVCALWSPVFAHLRQVVANRAAPLPLLQSAVMFGGRDAGALGGSELVYADRFDGRRGAAESGRGTQHNLRPHVTDFLGRNGDIETLVPLLGRTRLVTLVGPGGVGKTRLALEVAVGVTDRYADGVWMSELGPIDAGSDVVEAIAGSLGVKQREAGTTTDAVVEWLGPRTVLIVLDNCEHVLNPVRTFVERVLKYCPAVTFLLTSREALSLDGEHRWLTTPLSVPPPGVTDPNVACRYEAVELFVARASAATQDFALSAHNVVQVAEICRRLDGLPLALELAAARIPALSPSDLLEHLDERFRLLVGKRREPRQTLRGVVEWSYGLLEDVQRLLFQRLTVFAGSWSLDACRTVCAGGELQPNDIVDVLAELVAKSLVTTKLTANGMRYQMLETLRRYGQERIEESGEGEELRSRHAHWAHALVARVAPGLEGRDERASGDLLHHELDNLRVAVRWAIINLDAEVAFGVIASLENYMVLRLDFEVAAWAEQLLSTEAWAEHPRRHHALALVAYSAWARGDYDRAQEVGNEALNVERRYGSVPAWAAWQSVGVAAWFRGWQDQANQRFGEWVDRARAVGDDFNLSWALAHLAVVESFHDRFLATHHVDEALDLARRCGSPFLIALALYAKSECAIDDDPAAAMQQVREGVAIGGESGNRFAYGLCLSTLASLTGRLGQPSEALSLYRQAVENWRAVGNWTNQRILLRNLAEFAARIGEHALTVRLLVALDASGEMLAADIGPEGARLRDAADRARQALGEHRCDELAREGAHVHPLVLVRDTLSQLDGLIELAQATATVAEVSVSERAPGGLSPRERQVVALVTAGLTNREIAGRLFISERTVDTHITRIRQKLGTTTRTQLAVWGLEHREMTLGPSDPSGLLGG